MTGRKGGRPGGKPGPTDAWHVGTGTNGGWFGGPFAPGGGNGGGGGTPDTPDPWTSTQQSAFDLMADILNQYNLGSLTNALKGFILDGITDQATLQLRLQDTNEWKTRFAGNEMLRQKGVPVLSVAEYLSVERSYAQVLKNYGLPQGFYDEPSDFAQWIGNNVSANELNQRAQAYADLAHREDESTKAQLRAMGLSDGDLIAFMMDPTRAQPLVQQKYQTALIGSAARRTGLDASGAEGLAQLGINEQQAVQGYGIISEGLATGERLGNIYGEDFSQSDFESEVFKGDGRAAGKRKRLASQERANFSGNSGVVSGSLQNNSGGSY